jgi:hypothetical protein
MAALAYEVQTIDVLLWGTLQNILNNLDVQGNKNLAIAIDPLIFSSVIRPSEAYELTS